MGATSDRVGYYRLIRTLTDEMKGGDTHVLSLSMAGDPAFRRSRLSRDRINPVCERFSEPRASCPCGC